MSQSRSTEEVFRDHLDLRTRGEAELDIQRNYALDTVLIRHGRIYRGRDGVRKCVGELNDDIGTAEPTYDHVVVDGDVAFLEWSVHSNAVVVEDGVDTLIIRDGQIIAETNHYTVQRRAHSANRVSSGHRSPWRDSKDIDDEEAAEHAARLELRARSQDEVTVRDAYISLLSMKSGERVLEVGCGSGVVTRALAQRVMPDGKAVGADACSALLKIARNLANDAGLSKFVEFEEADCRNLPFPDRSFDAVVAVTTLSHVPNVERALAEMIRVTRPGGRMGIFDIDGDSTLISHPDRDLTRRIAAAFSDHGLVNGWLMRSLAGRLAELGLTDVRTRGFMPLDSGGYYARAAERAGEIAHEAGVISKNECVTWLEALRKEMAAGRFVSGRLHLFVWGTRSLS